MKALLLAGLAFALTSISAASEKYITIGDPAPSLSTAKWIKGTPVPKFELGKVYMVEFWATWCNPCKENIPHLTELAKKYKDRVSIIGVSIWETVKAGETDPMKKVVDFVKQQGSAMDYLVAADPKNQIGNDWMKAASEGGIPCAFIIGKDGKIAWIGYPTNAEDVLKKVLDGTYNVAAVREVRETRLKILRPIEAAMAAKKYAVAAKAIEEAIQDKPNLEYQLTYQRLVALFHSDVQAGIKLSQKILEETKPPTGAYYMISSIFASESKMPKSAYEYGVKVIDEARALTPRDYMLVAIRAEASFNLGDKAQAIKFAEEAKTMADKEPYATPEHKSLIKKNLEKYKTGTAARPAGGK